MMAEQIEKSLEVPNITPADAPATETDFDALLAEFEQSQIPQQTVDQSDAASERDRAVANNLNAITEGYALDARKAELEQQQQQLQSEYDARDTLTAIKEVRGDLDPRFFDDKFIQSYLISAAMENPQLNALWQGRAENPRAYQQAIGKLAAEFSQKYRRLPDPDATEDHFAVAQSVRTQGGRVAAEPPPDFGKMSPDEFHQWKKSNMPGY